MASRASCQFKSGRNDTLKVVLDQEVDNTEGFLNRDNTRVNSKLKKYFKLLFRQTYITKQDVHQTPDALSRHLTHEYGELFAWLTTALQVTAMYLG